MRRLVLSLALALSVFSVAAPVVAHADCSHGDTYDAHGSRCQ
jgi:hypothetical protein